MYRLYIGKPHKKYIPVHNKSKDTNTNNSGLNLYTSTVPIVKYPRRPVLKHAKKLNNSYIFYVN